MVKWYVFMIEQGKKTLEDVLEKWRDAVAAALSE